MVTNEDKKNLSYCTVIIWYNPSQSDIINTHDLAELISCVLVVDNSERSNSSQIKKANIQYYSLHKNLGIATALNYGFQKAYEQGYEYALSLDQDSNFNRHDLRKFEKYASKLFEDPFTAIVAASLENYGKIKEPLIKKTNITSGSMTSLNAWKTVGRFKDSFFIDHVDHEFCWRLIRKNFIIYQLPDVSMKHKLGNPQTRKLFGKTYESPGYSADRYYYYYRNRLYLAKYRNEPYSKVYAFLWRKACRVLMVEDSRFLKLFAMISGTIHFHQKKVGKRGQTVFFID